MALTLHSGSHLILEPYCNQAISFADFIHQDINGKEVPFDPILDSKFWPELMQLQDNITNLQAAADSETRNSDVITFEDVCLNPLSDEMDPSAGGCTIFSGEF